MDDFEQYTVISHQEPRSTPKYSDDSFGDFEALSDRSRVATVVPLSNSLRERHPDHHLTVIETRQCNLLGFARGGKALIEPDQKTGLTLRTYIPPVSTIDGAEGILATEVVFAKMGYRWQGIEFLVYLSEGLTDGKFGVQYHTFILCAAADNTEKKAAALITDKLILEASKWTLELHDEIWIFDQLSWQKSSELWRSAQEASWDDVILDEEMKEALRDDVEGFFEDREAYRRYAVPWKRGLIFHGAPGNGKTISIKALMKTLSNLPHPVASLYVKSFTKYNPEYGIRQVFKKARETAPCLLIFEDVDSLVTPSTRSYFLNEIDGLEKNEGICMVGSTNHLDLLDPGLSKRPSRFDRKYLFPLPSFAQRIQYSEFWRHKLAKNDAEIAFPKELSEKVAEITDGFSFAYMKEAFVASLLKLVTRKMRLNGGGGSDGGGLDNLPLWKEFKRQVRNLREELDQGGSENVKDLKGLRIGA